MTAAITTILAGTDGLPTARRALRWAAALPRPCGAVHAAHARGGQTFGPEGWPRPDLNHVEPELARMQAEHGPIPLFAVPYLPVPALDQVAQRDHAEAVVVGTRGHGSLHRLRPGRTPVHHLHHSSGPVVVVPHTS